MPSVTKVMETINPLELRRQKILLDYWRLRTVDTIRLYMELGND